MMKIKVIFLLTLAAVVLMTACDKADVNKDYNQMIMATEKSGEMILYMAGSGTMTIDWGDGTKIETYPLSAWETSIDLGTPNTKNRYSHTYSQKSARTISIIGDNIVLLYCYDNGLTNLDISKNTVLKDLSCDENLLTSLDVSKNTALTYLTCNKNQLTNLNVNTALTNLSCSNNQLISLDVRNTALTDLNCSSNKLTNLNVNNDAELRLLQCSYNQLINLDITTNTALNILFCYNNQLTTIDVSKNIVLTSLFCSNNQLSSLDVKNNGELRLFGCQSNNLTAEALNALFGTLHDNNLQGSVEKTVYIYDNPGANTVNNGTIIKGWIIDTSTPTQY